MRSVKDITEFIKNNGSFNTITMAGIMGQIRLPDSKMASIVISWTDDWEHVSVAPFIRSNVPTWKDMCFIKDHIFKDDEAAIQIHPPKSENISLVDNCLHIWRPYTESLVLPPSILVL